MLGDKPVCAVVATKDMAAAQKFYGETLGLKKGEVDDPSGTMYLAGAGTMIFVYPTEFAGTNKATAASWGVGEDLDKIVADLKSKGVTFEQYDLPGVTRDGDIHSIDKLRAVWFKDPDGNILNLVNNM
jgi:catechol 2,3-dioxygenase-like lactoylglutathione lyase family enzyme